MTQSWFDRQTDENNRDIERTDYLFCQAVNALDDMPSAFFEAVIDCFKSQRLMPDEIEQLNQLVQEAKKPEGELRKKLVLAFAEGLLDKDYRPLNDDDCLGTFSETIFRWTRECHFSDQVLYCEPRFVTGSSKTQGVDYFEILGNRLDPDSLYFIFWEIKGTDGSVTSRTDEIYQQHKKRTPRLVRGLQKKLSDRYDSETEPALHLFSSYLMDYWLTNSPQKRLGGCVVHGEANKPGIVFSTFARQFPDLADRSCRQVHLIQIPQFSEVRTRILELICDRIGLNSKP